MVSVYRTVTLVKTAGFCCCCFFKSHKMNKEEVKKIWRCADAVTFDVDSTVCIDEGIDELAAFMNVGDKVAQL